MNDVVYVYSAEGKPLSKKALKKQQKDAEKAKRKADTAAKLVCSLWLPYRLIFWHWFVTRFLVGYFLVIRHNSLISTCYFAVLFTRY